MSCTSLSISFAAFRPAPARFEGAVAVAVAVHAAPPSGASPAAASSLLLASAAVALFDAAVTPLIARLPHAQLVFHPRGARHMIDPSKLWAGASAVYGEGSPLAPRPSQPPPVCIGVHAVFAPQAYEELLLTFSKGRLFKKKEA